MSAIVNPDMKRALEQIAELRERGHCFGICANILEQPWRDHWSVDWFSTEALEIFLEREQSALRSAERSGSSKTQHQRRVVLLEEEIERRRKKYYQRRDPAS